MQAEGVSLLEGRVKVSASYAPGDPSREPFLFVHGLAQNETSGRALLRFFRGRGHPTLSFDWPGHGNSEAYQLEGPTIETLTATLNGVLEHFGISTPLIVGGHSMGGMIALQWAIRYPAMLKALILISAADLAPAKGNKVFDLKPMIDKVISDSQKIFVRQAKVDFSSNMSISEEEIFALGLMHTDRKTLKQFFYAAESHDVRGELWRVKMPCLVLRGRDDLVVNESMTAEMVNRLSASRAVTVPGGHNWFLQKPERLLQTLEENYGFLLNADASQH